MADTLAEIRGFAAGNALFALVRDVPWNQRNSIMTRTSINDTKFDAHDGERLIDAMNLCWTVVVAGFSE